MKKLTILAVMLMVSAAAFAQTNFKFGVTGGMNLSKVHIPNWNVNSDNKVGWSAGIIGELSFANNIYTNMSVLYSSKGYKYGYDDEYGDDKNTYNYVEAPIHIGYKYPVADKISILGEVGPTFGFLVSAKGVEEGYKWSGTEDFNKFNFGLGFKVGAEFINRIRLTIGYDWGLSNNYKDVDDWGKERNRNFSVGMVIFF